MTPTELLALEREYDEAARAYQATLTWENYMESPEQATQRKITVACLDVVSRRCPEVQVFNELCLQYRLRKGGTIKHIVPDNMIVFHDGKLRLKGAYPLELLPKPLVVMEYVSRSNSRKDYEGSYDKYEKTLKIPYYLLFNPDIEEMNLFHRGTRKYLSVKPNSRGRYEIEELGLETALLEGWVRYWHRGELLQLPGDLQIALEELAKQLDQASREREREQQRAENAERQLTRLREQMRAMGIDPDSLPQSPAG